MNGPFKTHKQHTRTQIRRRLSGPAHTLYVSTVGRPELVFDIDMVFVLQLENEHWLSDRDIDAQVLQGRWNLVPKPYKPDTRSDEGDTYWICSYAEIERLYLRDKNKMKYLIRIFKKIRDTNELEHLKSFYIKTVFLLRDCQVKRDYWNKSANVLFPEVIIGWFKLLQ